MSTNSHDDFHGINPFAEQAPFLVFYETYNEARYYKVRGKGCSTRNILKATRYETESYDEPIRSSAFERPWPLNASFPLSIYLSNQGHPKAYAGKHCLIQQQDIAVPFYDQVSRVARDLIRPLLRGTGPFGPAIPVGTDDHTGPYVAYITIELLFFPEESRRIPEAIRGFTRLAGGHFKGNRGTPPEGVVLDQPKDKLADKHAAMLAKSKDPLDEYLFLYSISEDLRDWCKARKMEGKVYETYDGGGQTGYVIQFRNRASRDLAADKFHDQFHCRQSLLGDAACLLGNLY